MVSLCCQAGDYRACSNPPLSHVSSYFHVTGSISGRIASPLSVGLCLPLDCEINDARATLLDRSVNLPFNITLNDVVINKVGPAVQSWDAGATMACVVLAVLSCCCIVGTIIQNTRRSSQALTPSSTSVEPLIAGSAPAQDPSADGSVNDATASNRPKQSMGWARTVAFFGHFDVARNYSRMVSVPEAQPSERPRPRAPHAHAAAHSRPP